MELILTHQTETDINVTCDGQYSHGFDLQTLILNSGKELLQPLDDPVTYGKAVYLALFPPGTVARHALETMPDRILLNTTDNDLDAVPWEYAYGPDGFLVLECHFVRGLPADQRITPPALDTGLHIVAVPSIPLSQAVEPLNIDGEWMRLKEIIQEVPYAITLERTRPPTIEQVHSLVANQRHRVIHFMGHGGQSEQGAVLYFEQDNGELDQVMARQFMLRIRGTVFLVTLNACVSATPGATTFSNLASALVRLKVPYALGMRFSIPDEDARTFSRVFYDDLARGSSVEEALLQARLTLANSPSSWVVGVPVLYTSLEQPAAGFVSFAGSPIIKEHQPHMEVSALPRAEGTFQGRIDELKVLGTALTGDSRPPLVTIHGAGGQGKTALARESVERFAYAWPGGVWASSLENLPSRELFVSDLARFLNIDIQTVADPDEVERLVVAHLAHRRTLIVLDNVETLVEAVEANNPEAIRLAQFLREQLPRPPVSLLTTSRTFLGWTSEISYELTGLAPKEGVRLFRQHAPQREKEIDRALLWELSEKVEGHPFSLRLLSGAFNASSTAFSTFVGEYEEQLRKAENKYKDLDHRQRTLYTSIDTSVQHLKDDLRSLLSGLWIFHAPFLAETAVAIFDSGSEDTQDNPSPVRSHLYTLWQRSLLARRTAGVRDGTLEFYSLPPTTRQYVEHRLKPSYERGELLARFGLEYAQRARVMYDELDRSDLAITIARHAREDFERAAYLVGRDQGYYLLLWGWILVRLGSPHRGLELLERALEMSQGQDQSLAGHTLNGLAAIYRMLGQPQRALLLCEQALSITRKLGDRAGEGAILNNLAAIYDTLGQLQQSLTRYRQVLPIMQEMRDRVGEATALSNMGTIYRVLGQPQQALSLYEQSLPIIQEVGNRAGEASILNNMAQAYDALGLTQRALRMHEKVLSLRQEVGDRVGEATTLNNLALIHNKLGYPKDALDLYKQALSITQETGSRYGEAMSLSGMARVYETQGQPQRALDLYEQALSIMQEAGDRISEATILTDRAYLFRDLHRYTEAHAAFEQSIVLSHQTMDYAGEVAGLVGLAQLLYTHFRRPQEAITYMEQAIDVLKTTSLSQDKAGHSLEKIAQLLQDMRTGNFSSGLVGSSTTIPPSLVEQIVMGTVSVMTTAQERHAELRELVAHALQGAQRQGARRQMEADFFSAVLAILDGQLPAIPPDHPYTQTITNILESIRIIQWADKQSVSGESESKDDEH